MAITIQVKRGLAANLPSEAAAGELLWTTDGGDLYVGAGTGNTLKKVTANVEGSYVPNSEKGSANGVATLDANGQVPTSQLSPLALTDVFTAANETEQLALTAQEGDVCVRTDENKSYIHNGGTAGDMTDWQELLTPTDTVQSVNGQTGVVSLDTDDINEGSTNLYYTDARADARIAAADLADIGDVVLTNVAADDYLKWDAANSQWINSAPQTISINDLDDVDTTTSVPTVGQTLHWDGTNWVPADDSNSISSLDDIGDVNVTGVTDGQMIIWDNTAGEWQASDLPTGVDGTFTGLTDTPNTYAAGDAGKFVRVNSAEDAIEFSTAAIADLSDVSNTTPTSGQVLKYDGTSWAPAADTDTAYTAGTGLSLTGTTFALDSGINNLTDVDTSTTSPSTDDVLAWDGSNWVPTSIDGGTF